MVHCRGLSVPGVRVRGLRGAAGEPCGRLGHAVRHAHFVSAGDLSGYRAEPA